MLKASLIQRVSKGVGLELIGWANRDNLEPELVNSAKRLETWQSNGYAAEMSYMQRDPSLYCSGSSILPDYRSVAVVFASYNPGYIPSAEAKWGFAKVARYAWGKDYHKVLRKRLISLLKTTIDEFDGPLEGKAFTDALPFLERTAARLAGLGFIGKNTMLIRPGLGSYGFIGEVFFNQEITEDIVLPNMPQKSQVSKDPCGSCTRCADNCPTDAIVDDRFIDSRKCISYLTIEKKTAFSDWEARAIGDWIFGCDICQEVCPFNHSGVESSRIVEFARSNGAGSLISLEKVLSLKSRDDFIGEFAGTPIMRAGREGLIRNACAVAANTKYSPALSFLTELSKSDESEIVRKSAEDALIRF